MLQQISHSLGDRWQCLVLAHEGIPSQESSSWGIGDKEKLGEEPPKPAVD